MVFVYLLLSSTRPVPHYPKQSYLLFEGVFSVVFIIIFPSVSIIIHRIQSGTISRLPKQ